tara:strand:+ start:1051 stop:1956 length:906 start_codon:yes stop_codon:yes gene_type:complete
MDGVLLFDKPIGLSSNKSMMVVKSLFNANKIGHTGTLDPFASGLLPLCFGEATKFSQSFLEAKKTYETTLFFGIKTSTGDLEGDIVERLPFNFDKIKLEKILKNFEGLIKQVPHKFSAIKKNGKPLYKYAREGIEVDISPREVLIHSINILEFNLPKIKLMISCSKGTYIRVLGEDIGKALGSCAHLIALRRKKVDELKIENSYNLDIIKNLNFESRIKLLLPCDSLLKSFPILKLSKELIFRFYNGQRLSLHKEGLSFPHFKGRVRVYSKETNSLIGTGRITDFGVLAPERLVSNFYKLK